VRIRRDYCRHPDDHNNMSVSSLTGERVSKRLTTHAPMRQRRPLPSIQGIRLREILVPTVRAWLAAGVSDEVLRSSVCIRDLAPISGGLKSDFVGRLELELEAVIKLGRASWQIIAC